MFFFFIFFTVSHKMMGLLYFLLSIMCGFCGYMYSALMSLELSTCGCSILFGDYQFYNCLVTAHGLMMFFAFVMPITMGGFANYYAPLLLGFPDMVFPSMNNMSFWLFLCGVSSVLIGFITEEGYGTGWTLYPTLICYDFHSSLSCDFVMFAVHLLGFSSLINSLNVVGTLYCCKRKYYSFMFWLMFLWGILLTSFLLIICLPVLSACVTMVLLDSNFNTSFYDVCGGGDLMMFQHLFWFFGHPEVYIVMIPVFGLMSLLMDVHGTRCVFSSLSMIYSMIGMLMLSFFVWVHHMFVIGLDCDTSAYFGSLSLFMGIPTCMKLFNWIYSFLFIFEFWICEIYCVCSFLFMFLFGGITGLLLANVGMDTLTHDTYFVVAHFHYVLSLGAVIGMLGGFIHFTCSWLPVEYSFFLMFIFMIIITLGTNFMFLPLHNLGLLGFPSSISDYPINYIFMNSLTFMGFLIMFMFMFMFHLLFCFLNFWDIMLFKYCFLLLSLNTFFNFFNQIIPMTCVLYLLFMDFAHMIYTDCFMMLSNFNLPLLNHNIKNFIMNFNMILI